MLGLRASCFSSLSTSHSWDSTRPRVGFFLVGTIKCNLMSSFNDPLSDDEARALTERLQSYEERGAAAQAKAAQAYARLINLAETRNSGQIQVIAQFLAATYNGTAFKFDLFDLRVLDVEISDDMLIALDALRWGKDDLYCLVPDGGKTIEAVIDRWGLRSTNA